MGYIKKQDVVDESISSKHLDKFMNVSIYPRETIVQQNGDLPTKFVNELTELCTRLDAYVNDLLYNPDMSGDIQFTHIILVTIGSIYGPSPFDFRFPDEDLGLIFFPIRAYLIQLIFIKICKTFPLSVCCSIF